MNDFTVWSSGSLTSFSVCFILTGLCVGLWCGDFRQWFRAATNHPRCQTWQHSSWLCWLLTTGWTGKTDRLVLYHSGAFVMWWLSSLSEGNHNYWVLIKICCSASFIDWVLNVLRYILFRKIIVLCAGSVCSHRIISSCSVGSFSDIMTIHILFM